MEPWQILLAVVLLGGAYLGGKWIEHLTENKRTEADVAKTDSHNEVTKKMLETHRDIFLAARDAGRKVRLSILKGVSGVTQAEIGYREYDTEQIAQIRRRAARVKATSETTHECLVVEELDARDKNNPVLIVRVKDTELVFKATLALNPEDYPDFDEALDMVWNSARFPDRYFWAEISFSKRRGRILSATISALASAEEDLPQNSDDMVE